MSQNSFDLFGFFVSSIGKKILMAVTGVIMLCFVIAHLMGNLLMFGDPGQINCYAHFLKSLGPLLWIFRAIMLLVLLVHVSVAAIITRENMAACPDKYICRKRARSGLPSNYMGVLGSLIAVFLIFHILHFTINIFIYPQYGTFITQEGYQDVYKMVLLNFQIPWVAAFYIFMMAVLGLHLWHCIRSFFQTIGISHACLKPIFNYGGKILSVVIALGYMSIPIAVLMGWIE